MNRKIVKISILVSIVMLLFSGCGYSMEERKRIANIEEQGRDNAIAYIEEKYGFTPKVVEVEVIKYSIFYGGLFPTINPTPNPTGDVYVSMRYNGKDFLVYINGEEETANGYDNYQSDKIARDFYDMMEDIIDGEIEKLVIAFGKFDETSKYKNEWGLVQNYYDGTNLAEVLDSSDYNNAVINLLNGEAEDISAADVADSVGRSTKCLFVKYRDKESYKCIEDSGFNMLGYDGMEENSLFISEYVLIAYGDKEYAKYDLFKADDIFYIMENGTYCNFVETQEDTSKWQWYGRENEKQIFKTYEIDTDASCVYIWISRSKLGVGTLDDVYFGYQYYSKEENDYIQYRDSFTHTVSYDQYIYTDIVTENKSEVLFSVFKEVEN